MLDAWGMAGSGEMIHVLVVGWSGSGKTSLIRTLTGQRVEDVMSIFHQTQVSIAYKGERIEFVFTDTQSESEYSEYRRSLYEAADIIFITHSSRCQARWVAETREFAPGKPAVFVGLKLNPQEQIQKTSSLLRLRSKTRLQNKSNMYEPPLLLYSLEEPEYPYILFHEAITRVRSCYAKSIPPPAKWKSLFGISIFSN